MTRLHKVVTLPLVAAVVGVTSNATTGRSGAGAAALGFGDGFESGGCDRFATRGAATEGAGFGPLECATGASKVGPEALDQSSGSVAVLLDGSAVPVHSHHVRFEFAQLLLGASRVPVQRRSGAVVETDADV